MLICRLSWLYVAKQPVSGRLRSDSNECRLQSALPVRANVSKPTLLSGWTSLNKSPVSRVRRWRAKVRNVRVYGRPVDIETTPEILVRTYEKQMVQIDAITKRHALPSDPELNSEIGSGAASIIQPPKRQRLWYLQSYQSAFLRRSWYILIRRIFP
jgi:hypothetical protein